MENPIPTQELKHENQRVFFAYRSMEENHERTGGKPDVPHKHDFYTIIMVRNACGKHFVDYEEYPFESRIIFLLSPGQVHQVISSCQPSGDIIMFDEEFLQRNYISEDFISNLGLFSCAVGTPPLKTDSETFEKLQSISREIKDTFESDNTLKFDTIGAYLKLFLIECNKFAIPSKSKNPQSIESEKPLVRKFKYLLDVNYMRWHKVSEYANQMNINPDYLNNVLKQSVGKNAKEMIVDRIVLQAKRLGLHTALSSKEISYQLGFEDPSHFSKLFKKESKQSFSDFRKKLEFELKN